MCFFNILHGESFNSKSIQLITLQTALKHICYDLKHVLKQLRSFLKHIKAHTPCHFWKAPFYALHIMQS